MRIDWRVSKKLARFLLDVANKSLSQQDSLPCRRNLPRLRRMCENWSACNVVVYVSRSNAEPYCVGQRIHLPHPSLYDNDYGLIARSLLHEMSHARDNDFGIDTGPEDSEDRANAAELALSQSEIRLLAMNNDLRSLGVPSSFFRGVS